MNKRIITLDELKYSKILFNKNIPAFGYMIIISVLLLLSGALVWSINTPKTYMIKAVGTVTNDKSNYIMSSFGGEISNSQMYEGKVVNEGDILFCINSNEINMQYHQLTNNRVIYQTRIENHQKLITSIKDDTNYFDSSLTEDNLYYTIFENYKAQVNQYLFDASTYKNYGYTDEQIEFEISKNQAKITEIYYTAIQNAENAISECELQLASINSQLSALESAKEAYIITATASGRLHMLADYKNGMVVQAGVAVASITPENEDVLIEAYVSPTDRARMNDNDNVEIAVTGLNQSTYGIISGQVVQIDSDLTTNEKENGGNNTVFKVKIKPDFDYLVSKSGDKVNLLNGMAVEARIQYDKVTYFDYILEKLGLLVR